ncbi:cell wall-binding repeat-containing protein [Clostridium kluyveri]|uniref:Cell wall-binding repeat 2 family protein n=1 Tax=Clostridium kluyveri TaxID=1534 RepID=A0A1L5FBB3_CLOKL|nr:cell wall-binding repeat-containing protein [Clostridium kluyveri]APM40311.1 hypothetical protein BS101_17005 [Clostridium kluyveri]
MKKEGKKILSVCSIASLLIAGSAVSTSVKAADSSSIIRIGGTDRYETAAKIAEAGWNSSNYAIVANGEGYADALCAVPLAKANDAPILLTTSSNSLNQNTLNELKNLKVNHVIVVGGTGVVSDSVVDSIKTQVTSDVERLGGQDRYETSVKIAEKLGSTSKIVVASGEGYADALSAAPAAAIEGMPILLTRSTILPDVTSNYITSNSEITKTYVIGGTASVSNSVADSLKSAERFGGADRYETNVDVIEGFASDFKFNNIYAALGNGPIGNEFADALTGGALAAKNKNPLVITGQTLSSSTKQLLKDKVYTNATITVIGGTANISDSLAEEMKDAFGVSPSTGGGGGGGGSSSSGDNITAKWIKTNQNYKNIVSRLNGGDLQNSYFTIADDTTGTVNVELKKNYTSAEDIFNRAQEKYNQTGNIDESEIRQDIANFNERLTSAYSSLTGITANEDTLQDILKNSGSKYINSTDGTLNADEVVDEIINKAGDYDDGNGFDELKEDLTSKVEAYFENHPSKDKTVEVMVEGYVINKVQKGNETLYKASSSTEESAKDLIDLILPTTSATGKYYIYLNNDDYVLVNIALQ